MPALSTRDLRSPDLPAGTDFQGTFLVRKVSQKTARNANPFLVVELGDREGSFTCNIFGDHAVFEELRSAVEGTVAEITGRTDSYNGRFSPRILEVRLHRIEDLDTSQVDRLVECAPESIEVLWAELAGAASALRPAELAAAVSGVLDEIAPRMRICPAASSMHHAYRGGLLEHTVHMVRAARALLPLYPEVPADLALAGVILHDTGKALEFEPGLNPIRGRTGLLNGHVVLGYRLLRKHGLREHLSEDLLERLEHIILSHQGELEWGAAVKAATPEAVFVSMVDNLDAKMGMVQRALRTAAAGTEFSERLSGLDSPLLIPRPEDPDESST